MKLHEGIFLKHNMCDRVMWNLVCVCSRKVELLYWSLSNESFEALQDFSNRRVCDLV